MATAYDMAGIDSISRYVSLDTGAEILGISVKTLRRWIAEGRLAAYRYGPRLVRVDLSEVASLPEKIPAGEFRGAL